MRRPHARAGRSDAARTCRRPPPCCACAARSPKAFRLDPATGAVTAVGSPVPSGTNSFASLHPSGRFLLEYNIGAQAPQRYSLDPTTGAPTLAPETMPLATVGSFLIDSPGRYLMFQ